MRLLNPLLVVTVLGALIGAVPAWAGAGSLPPVLSVALDVGADEITLAPRDPVSLALRGEGAPVHEYHFTSSFAPDGRRVALGAGSPGSPTGGIPVYSTRPVRFIHRVQTGIAAEHVAWLAPRRVVGVLQRGGIVLADPVTATIVGQWEAELAPQTHHMEAENAPGGRVVALLAAGDRLAPARLAVVDANGLRGSVEISRIITAHFGFPQVVPVRLAGLAVDPDRGVAYVAGAGAPIAEVDLATLAVRYLPVTLPAADETADSVSRHVAWLGGGRLAVSGADGFVVSQEDFRSVAAGARVVDVRTNTVRVIEPDASRVRRLAGRLLVFGGHRPGSAVGLRIYDGRGERRLRHLFGTDAVGVVAGAGGLAHVFHDNARRVLKLHTFRVIGEFPSQTDAHLLGFVLRR